MKHIGLFEGIGGFSLAAHWMGWETIAWCEINEFCQKVLHHHFPDAEGYSDITTTDFSQYAIRDYGLILTGGWPCQRYSIAGKKEGNEPLKQHLLRAIEESKPDFCVLENVGNFVGNQFAQEHSKLVEHLEDCSYQVQTLDIDAASVGLSTVERHIWIVAKANSPKCERHISKKDQGGGIVSRKLRRSDSGEYHRWSIPANRVCRVGKGIPGRLANGSLSGSRWHRESLKALGNAIPPEVAYQIFKAIEETEMKLAQ